MHAQTLEPPGPWLIELLERCEVGEEVVLPRWLALEGQAFSRLVVKCEFKTASRARLLQLLPGGTEYIFKCGDVRQEYAVMQALHRMNQRWRDVGVAVCGLPVQVATYEIIPIGEVAGLVRVVAEAWTLRELSRACAFEERHLRVVRALHADSQRLNRLASTTIAYLTANYVLGVRDGHDDNIMLRADGTLFRVDFGFIFGATPEIDGPQTILPRAVTFALGEQRWRAVVDASRPALEALTGLEADSPPPAWDVLSGVHEFGPLLPKAFSHTSSLSVAGFCRDVARANVWSLSRAAKNALREVREAVRSWTEGPADATVDSGLDLLQAAVAEPGLLGLFPTVEQQEPDRSPPGDPLDDPFNWQLEDIPVPSQRENCGPQSCTASSQKHLRPRSGASTTAELAQPQASRASLTKGGTQERGRRPCSRTRTTPCPVDIFPVPRRRPAPAEQPRPVQQLPRDDPFARTPPGSPTRQTHPLPVVSSLPRDTPTVPVLPVRLPPQCNKFDVAPNQTYLAGYGVPALPYWATFASPNASSVKQ